MHGSFLQSPEWERVHKEVGRKTWRIDGILIIRHELPRGFNYLYCSRPRLSIDDIRTFLSGVERIAKIERSLFLKIDPVEPLSLEGMHVRFDAGVALQPQQTTVLDITKSEEDLLAGMHEKTRYNINLAQRKGIEVIQIVRPDAHEDFDFFWKLLNQTSERGGFSLHERRYYELLSRIRTTEMSNEFFFARVHSNRNEMLAAAMINFSRDPHTGVMTATYLHGASSREHRELMASHALHWRIIHEAKQRNTSVYDFWGIDEVRWPGVTRFKLGFGGDRVAYPKAVHVIYRPQWYKLYMFLSKRKINK
ncbi:MAG: peptidoglycan bridge formation glycyltransferase FemA/FemB family protein [bacterium]|nr:peptidoglycan bridge formation glycyltransferase FemA/FemB family protein [bacterium]MDZ4285615.1 peptidoglycan bridge formation glycyltransferase FemA/FemB family protein [Candidatus Sungbacteria bacterium]